MEIMAPVLPFTEKRQNALLGHLITNKNFYHQCIDKIKKHWFLNAWAGEVWSLYLQWTKENDPQLAKLPSEAEITNSKVFMDKEPSARTRLMAAIQSALLEKNEQDLEAIVNELTVWLKCRIYLDSIPKSTDLFNAKKVTDAFSVLETTIRDYNEVKFFQEDEVDFGDFANHFAKVDLEKKDALTTGLDVLDKVIDPTCQKGSLLKGDTTVILAPVNLGKSSFLITAAVANVKQFKKVLLLTHEGRPEDIQNKIWQNLTQRTFTEVMELHKQQPNLFIGGANLLRKYLRYVPLNMPGLTVEEVARIIEKKQADEIQKTGVGFDLVVDDYPAKLTTSNEQVGRERRHSDAWVYNYFVQLALKHKFHCLLAQQTNREASKNNRFQGDHGTHDRLIVSEDAAEAFGPVQTATTLISLNRNSAYGERIIFHLCKSRSGVTEMSVMAKTAYSKATTHSNTLGGVWYRGTMSLSHITDDILEQYLGQALPDDQVGTKVVV